MPNRFAVVHASDITFDDEKEYALVKIPREYKEQFSRVYGLFEVTRHDGDNLVDIYFDREFPDMVAKNNPASAMDGFYVKELWIKT